MDYADEGFIYILYAHDDIYKIGKAKHLPERISQVQIQLPFQVTLYWWECTDRMGAIERDLHDRLAHKRMNGEWFRLNAEEITFIKNYVSKGPAFA